MTEQKQKHDGNTIFVILAATGLFMLFTVTIIGTVKNTQHGYIAKVDSFELNGVHMQILQVQMRVGTCTAITQSDIKKYEYKDRISVIHFAEKDKCTIDTNDIGTYIPILWGVYMSIALLIDVCVMKCRECSGKKAE